MNKALLFIVALMYFWAAANYYFSGRLGMSVAFGAYAIANLGFMLDVGE